MLIDSTDTAGRAARIGKDALKDLDVLCLTAMHKDPERRCRSVEALIRDIDHYRRDEPLEARPDSVRYRASKFVRRNRRALSATVVISSIFIALIIFFVVRLARARDAAVAETTRTQRIERFMLSLFDGGDKTAGPAGGLRAEALLDRGVQSARTLSAEPALQAELYQRLGKFEEAAPLLRSSLDQRKSTAGPESSEVAASFVALGLLRLDQGQLADAERLVREGLAIDKRHLPAKDPALGRDLSVLGHVLGERGSYDNAIKNLDEAIQVQSATHEITTDLPDSTTALANVQYYVGPLPASDSLYKRALAMDRQLFGAIHPRVADDYYGLGTVQHGMGNDRQAEKYFRQALGIHQSWYGKEHPDSALMMAAVGQSLTYQGRYNEAAPMLQESLAIQERIFGQVNPQVAMGLNTLGLLEIKRRHLADAAKDFKRMADINRAVYDDRHYLVGVALLNLGQVYLEEKQYTRAEAQLREALVRFTEKLPPGHSSTAIAQIQIGHALMLERRYAEAESHLLAGYGVLLKQPGPQAQRIQNSRKDLAAVYKALSRPDEARKFQDDLNSNSEKQPRNPASD